MRPVFKNPVLQSQFTRDGFVVVPFLSKDEVLTLNNLYDQLPARSSEGFFSGIYTHDRGFKQRSHELLADAAADFAHRFLDDYRMLVGNFVLKYSDDKSAMPCHQDWTFVDEEHYSSINIWCALNDTTYENGALHLIPSSHRLPSNVRGTNIPDSLSNCGVIPFAQMSCLEVPAGHAIVHDHRVLHASPPNISGRRRLATAICMIPSEADAKHFFINPKTGLLEAYSIDTNFFYDYTYGDLCLPVSAVKINSINGFKQYQFISDEVVKLLKL